MERILTSSVSSNRQMFKGLLESPLPSPFDGSVISIVVVVVGLTPILLAIAIAGRQY